MRQLLVTDWGGGGGGGGEGIEGVRNDSQVLARETGWMQARQETQ